MYGLAISMFRALTGVNEREFEAPIWGDYNRLRIEEASSLKDLVSGAFAPYLSEATILLYSYKGKKDLNIQFIKEEDIIRKTSSVERFVGIITFTMHDNAKAYVYNCTKDVTQNISSCIERVLCGKKCKGCPISHVSEEILDIEEIFKRKNKDGELKFDCYNVLGSQDVALIIEADKCSELLEAVDKIHRYEFKRGIKGKKKPVFCMTNSLIVLNFTEENKNNFFDNAEEATSVQIQATFRPGKSSLSWRDELLSTLYSRGVVYAALVLGEFDFLIQIQLKSLTADLYDKGLLSPENDLYREAIMQCNTRVIKKYDNNNNNEYQCDSDNKYYKVILKKHEETKKLVKKLTEIVSEKVKTEKSGLINLTKEMLDAIHLDYIKNSSISIHKYWLEDLHYQYNAFLRVLTSLFEQDIVLTKKLEALREVISGLRQNFNRITLAARFSSSLRNTPPCDKVLRYYYGIIKELLRSVYKLDFIGGKQPELVPFLIIGSEFSINSTLVIDSSKMQEIRILIISLPLDAFYNIAYCSAMLVHELFHYIRPRDKELRNLFLGCVVYVHEFTLLFIGKLMSAFELGELNLIEEQDDGGKMKTFRKRLIMDLSSRKIIPWELKKPYQI